MDPYTVNSLNRWNSLGAALPEVSSVKEIHVYDFDNTLFNTPIPNPNIWERKTLGRLQSAEFFVEGCWWHHASVLEATGLGAAIEESKGWDGHWNEKIVELARMSMGQDDVLTVLLTGRSEKNFQDLVGRICQSKGLRFDIMALKPLVGPNNENYMSSKTNSTKNFKKAFLTALIQTYNNAVSLTLYEDRERHIVAFRNFFQEITSQLNRKFEGEVVGVKEVDSYLNPYTEVLMIQRIINLHNQTISTTDINPGLVPLVINKFRLGAGRNAYKLSVDEELDPTKLVGSEPIAPPAGPIGDKRGHLNKRQHGWRDQGNYPKSRGMGRGRGGSGGGVRGGGRGAPYRATYRDLDAQGQNSRGRGGGQNLNMYNSY